MLRRASSLLASSLLRASRGARGVSSSAAARGSAHDPDYVHAKHMYDIQSISNRRLKFGLGTIAVAGGGAAVTAIAVNHAQSKAKGG